MRVPLVDLGAQHASIRAEVMAAAEAVIASQAFILGEPVARFEATLARMCGAAHAIGVASGSDALALALQALGIGPGDAVVTAPFTFVATAEAIVRVGARPIFADIDPATLTL
jgi:dTDP-4-amino-4,6-dideoxygalactose transaminase